MSTLFDGMMAYQQILALAGGFFCLSLGILLAGNEVYWRTKAIHVAAIVAGVRAKAGVYYPVYRYQLPNGQIHEATSDIGSSGARGKETGRAVRLLVFENDPTSARAADSWAFGIIGTVMTLPGLLLVYVAFTRYPVTKMTGFMAIAMLCYCGMKLQGILKPQGGKLNLSTWKAAMKQKHAEEMQGIPITRIEDTISPADLQKRREQQAKSARLGAPLLLVGGVLLILGGVHIGTKLSEVLQYGVSTKGQVTSLQSAMSSNSTVYYPVVSFKTVDGRSITFKDGTGESPPEFSAGATVTVIYLPHDPEHSAIIDRGAMNYFGPGLMLAMGTVFAGIGAVMFVRTRRTAETREPPV